MIPMLVRKKLWSNSKRLTAYTVLSDPNKRRQHDLSVETGKRIEVESVDVEAICGLNEWLERFQPDRATDHDCEAECTLRATSNTT